MSMMSNFPADGRRRRIGFALFAALTVLCVGACAPKPPEAAATRPVGTSERPPTIDRSALTRPVALRAVTAAQFDWRDAVLTRLFRRVVPEGAVEAIVIRVHTVDPIDSTPRASIPAIVLNGTVLKTTRVDPTVGNQLVAVLLDRTLIKERNIVAAVWLGNETATLTRNPLVFTSSEIRP